jgi:septal ring factor EnvC (AmiA/AmiB activator)
VNNRVSGCGYWRRALGISGTRNIINAALLSSFLLPLSSFAQSTLPKLQQELQKGRQVQQQQQQRIQQLNQDLGLIDSVTKENLSRLARLEDELVRLEEERASLTRQIGLLQGQVDEANVKIESLESELRGLKERLSVLMNNLHREKAGRYLPLLRAQSFTDLATRARWVSVLGKEQTTLMERITFTVKQLEDERTRLTLLVQDLNQKQALREERIQQLSTSRVEFQEVLTTLQQQKQGRQAILRITLQAQAQLQQDLATIQGRIIGEQKRLAEEQRQAEIRRRAIAAAKAKAEKERKAKEAAIKAQKAREAAIKAQRAKEEREAREAEAAAIAAAREARQAEQQAPNGPSQVQAVSIPRELSGNLLFPMSGGEIAARYGETGNNYQEIRGRGSRSPVRAAAKGLVVTQYNPNLGWIVLIQHTETLFTIYNNLQDLQVVNGQQVGRGETIGVSGGGALIPDDTIWFQVSLNNTYINPAVLY